MTDLISGPAAPTDEPIALRAALPARRPILHLITPRDDDAALVRRDGLPKSAWSLAGSRR